MKQKKKSRKRAAAVLKFLLIFVLLAATVAFIALSPLFNIKTIEVRGSTRYDNNEIADMSGIIPGQNAFRYMAGSPSDIFRLRFGNAEKLLEEQYSYIKDVKVRLAVPASVIIEIVERQPAAFVPYLGTGLVIDEEGDVLEMASNSETSKLLVIKGLEFDNCQIGKPLPLHNREGLKKAFELAEAIKQSDEKENDKLYPIIGWIDVSDPYGIKILLDNRITVNLGNLEELNYRIDATRLIFTRNIKKEDKGTLDFTAGDNPVYKPGQ